MDKEIYARKKKKKNLKRKNNDNIIFFLSKFLITIILTLIVLIVLKSNNKFKSTFYNNIYEKSMSFVTINKLYEKYFGSSIPLKKVIKESKEVFNENLKYSTKNKYKDGVKLTVDKNYLVPILESGMVVYIGKKEGYGNTIIVQQVDGVDTWYGNINNTDLKLYDYVEKGKLLGEVKNESLYLVFKKAGKVLSYEDKI